MKHSPSCNCCLCLISIGDQNGEEVIGDWTYTIFPLSHSITTPIPNQRAVWIDTSEVTLGGTWKVSVKVGIATNSVNGEFNVTLFGGWRDARNYVALRYREVRPAFGSGLSYINMSLVVASDPGYTGTSTSGFGLSSPLEILANHVDDVNPCITLLDETFYEFYGFTQGSELDDQVVLTLCWDGVELTGSIDKLVGGNDGVGLPVILSPSTQTNLRLAANHTSLPTATGTGTGAELSELIIGTRAGFGVGGLSASILGVSFSEFNYRRAEMSDGSGNQCEDCERHCCGSPVPSTLIVEVTGVPTTELVGTPERRTDTSPCDVACGAFNGTFIVPHAIAVHDPAFDPPPITGTASSSAVYTICVGDGFCQWIDSYYAGNVVCNRGLEQEYSIPAPFYIKAITYHYLGSRYVLVWIRSVAVGFGPFTGVVLVASGELPSLQCDACLNVWIDLTVGSFPECQDEIAQTGTAPQPNPIFIKCMFVDA